MADYREQSTDAAVTVPGVAAATGDASLVVALSPSSPLPVGNNVIGAVTGMAGAALALDGVDITAPTAMPAGGVGIRGWLSAIWTRLNSQIQTAVFSGSTAIGTRGDGFLRVSIDPTTLIIDAFDAAIDTTNIWTPSATAPTLAAGNVSFPVGTAASAASHLTSKGNGIQGASGYLIFASMATLAAAVQTNSKRYWGLVNMATTPTAAIPFASAAVFEVAEDGILYGAAYSAGVRTFAVALPQPTDGMAHRFAIYYKTSKIYFEIDGLIVGTLTNPNISGAVFRLGMGVINGTVAPAAQPTFSVSIASMGDTGRNNTKISDGQYPWRQVRVSASGEMAVSGSPSPNQGVSVTGLSGAAVTATLPAPPAGMFHYITGIDIELYAAVARLGAANPIIVTTTNFPGGIAWNFPTAGAVGTIDRYEMPISAPIKMVAATATTIVCPAALNGIWRTNVTYYTA